MSQVKELNYTRDEINAFLKQIADGSFAPSGFGLGGYCPYIPGGDWNNAIYNGWYMYDDGINAPTDGWYLGLVYSHNSKYIVQRVIQFNGGKFWWERICHNDVWSDWKSEAKTISTNEPTTFIGEGAEWIVV